MKKFFRIFGLEIVAFVACLGLFSYYFGQYEIHSWVGFLAEMIFFLLGVDLSYGSANLNEDQVESLYFIRISFLCIFGLAFLMAGSADCSLFPIVHQPMSTMSAALPFFAVHSVTGIVFARLAISLEED